MNHPPSNMSLCARLHWWPFLFGIVTHVWKPFDLFIYLYIYLSIYLCIYLFENINHYNVQYVTLCQITLVTLSVGIFTHVWQIFLSIYSLTIYVFIHLFIHIFIGKICHSVPNYTGDPFWHLYLFVYSSIDLFDYLSIWQIHHSLSNTSLCGRLHSYHLYCHYWQ